MESGTQDPPIPTSYKSNRRGEIIAETDSIGRTKKYLYDPMGRRTGIETYNIGNEIVDWHYSYYNGNGEISWEQEASFNPNDYTYYDYDRAGHLIHKLSWLVAADPKGAGVVSGGFAESDYTYDGAGHLTSIIDPNGHITKMSYDALGEMISRSFGDGFAQESFSYDAAGNLTSHTRPLHAQERYCYTLARPVAERLSR